MRRLSWLLVPALGLFANAAGAATITLPSDLQVTWTVNGAEAPWIPDDVTNTCAAGTGDATQCEGNYTWSGATLTWDVSSDPDPFINSVFGFTNNTGFTQTYILTSVLPIAPAILGGSLIGGSSQITINDSNFNGTATVTSVAPILGTGFVYNALIDGSDVEDLHGPGFSLSAPFAGGGATANAFFGLPGPTQPGPPALASIGIRHEITLTPGDSVTLNSNFIVVVPEPTTIGLVTLGLAGLALAGRRRLA
jgi:hypothetical protein